MKQYIIHIAMLTVFLAGLQKLASADWTQTMGPEGGEITAVAQSLGYIYAGTENGGVFVSKDTGSTWTAINKGLISTGSSSFPILHTLFADGNTVFAGCGSGGGIFRSTDYGENWVRVKGYTTYSFAKKGSTLFAAQNPVGIILSTDDGSTWSEITNGLPATILSVAVCGNNVLAGSSGRGIFVSTDDGYSWTCKMSVDTSRNPPIDISSFAVSSHLVIAGGKRGTAIYVSRDSGMTWKSATSGRTLSNVNSLATGAGKFIAGTDNGVFVSSDTAINWKKISIDTSESSIDVVATASNAILAATTANGMLRSKDNGISWSTVNNGIIATNTNQLMVQGHVIFACTYVHYQPSFYKVFRSDDKGNSWKEINTGLPLTSGKHIYASSDRLFVGTYGKIRFSDDNGETWTDAILEPGSTVTGFVSGYDDVVYASTDNGLQNGLQVSNDNGTTWQTTVKPAVEGNFTFIKHGSSIFAADREGTGVYHTSDNGNSWVQKNSGLLSLKIYDIAASGNTLFAIEYPNNYVFISTNNGDTWIKSSEKIVYDDIVAAGDKVFTCSSIFDTTGVFVSGNSALVWKGAGEGLINHAVSNLAVCDSMLFAGIWGSGVWRRPLSEFANTNMIRSKNTRSSSLLEIKSVHSTGSILSVEFTIPAAGNCVLTLHTLSGKTLATLEEGFLEPGRHIVHSMGKVIPGGVYMLQLKAGNNRISKCLTVLNYK